MERKKFLQNFSRRLTSRIIECGYGASRSSSKIDIQKLSEVSGCSYQMARKYALGEALPELNILVEIAKWLNISASWLLFGEEDRNLPQPRSGAFIEIECDLLKYIINKSIILFSLTSDKDSITNFIVDTAYDASHLNADKGTLYKIVDMMISSTRLLNTPNKENTEVCNL